MSDVQPVQRMPISASDVKKGTYIILKSRPVKVLEVKTSKTGKHGHAKSNITGTCVLTTQKCNDVFPSHTGLTEFKLEKIEYMVMSAEIDDGTYEFSVLNAENEEVTFRSNPSSEQCKGKELYEAVRANPDKSYLITILRAPVEVGSDYVDEQLIESFKEARD